MKQIYWVYFKDNFDDEAVDEICESFPETTNWREDNKYRFYGTPERLEEFKRAVATVEIIDHIV